MDVCKNIIISSSVVYVSSSVVDDRSDAAQPSFSLSEQEVNDFSAV